jgi:hypothetical protein
MPPQTNVYVTAPQAVSPVVKAKAFLGFFKSKADAGHDWSTIRALGQSTRGASRRPVFE